MGNLYRKAIYCPKTEHHAHPKILLLIADDKLTVRCNEHEWIDIQLKKGKDIIDFSNVLVNIMDVPKGTIFDLEILPAIASGDFKTKKKRIYDKI